MTSDTASVDTRCCIVGGGPAGVMLGFLLSRVGIDVVVLEKHADFFRDFRGDTIHPSTLQLLSELGLLDAFLALPHNELTRLTANVGGAEVTIADFSHVPTVCKFIAIMPQWDFLNFLSSQAARSPRFRLLMQTEATGLIIEKGRVAGVTARGADGMKTEIRALLTIGADGRHSIIRERAQLPRVDVGAPIDVLWLRIEKRAGDQTQALGNIRNGHFFITIDRHDYWQCAFVIAKGQFETIKAAGIERLRAMIVEAAPFLEDRIDTLREWNQVQLLTVVVDRLERWYREGLLCIGDAAHAMSPIGGVGINLAIQDAVAAANLLFEPLLRGQIRTSDLAAVQRRRTLPTRMTQAVQVFIQNRVVVPVLSGKPLGVPLPLKLLQLLPVLQRIPARIVGVGFRPEHTAHEFR